MRTAARRPLLVRLTGLSVLLVLPACGASPVTEVGTSGLQVGVDPITLVFPSSSSSATHLGGGVLPCLTEGTHATVQAVSAHTEPKSAAVKFFLRRIPGISERHPGVAIEWAPMVSWDGPLSVANASGQIRGKIVPLTSGTTLDLPCPENGRDIAAPVNELILEVTATQEGAKVRDVEISYELGGRSGRAMAKLDIDVCGTEVRPQQCADLDKHHAGK